MELNLFDARNRLIVEGCVTRLGKKEPQYKIRPSGEEWEFAKEVCKKLKFFLKDN